MGAGIRFFDKAQAQAYNADSYEADMKQNMLEAVKIQSNIEVLKNFEPKLKEKLFKLKNNIKSENDKSSDLDKCSEAQLLEKLKINLETQKILQQKLLANEHQRYALMQLKKKAEEADVKEKADKLFKQMSPPFKM